jgi:hypothetical protein
MRCVVAMIGLMVGCDAIDAAPGEGRAGALVAWRDSTCVVLRDGGVACWGRGSAGELGIGAFSDSARPVRVPELAGVDHLVVSDGFGAVTDDAFVFFWEQVGESESRPRRLPLPGVLDFASTTIGHCALLAGGEIQCPGRGLEVARWYGDYAVRLVPSQGGTTGCAARGDGTLACFDPDARGGPHPHELPAPSIDASNAPSLLLVGADGLVREETGYQTWRVWEGVDGVTRIAANANVGHKCLLRADGRVLCWGSNQRGQLGNGTLEPSDTPVEVVGLSDAVAIAVGDHHTCAVRRNGRLACWGANDRGQLGNDTIDDAPVPVEVVGIDLRAGTVAEAPLPEHRCLERDSDGDGLSDRDELRGNAGSCGSSPFDDGDGVPPELDDDSDDDGIPDALEHRGDPCHSAFLDTDSDLTPAFLDRDSDDDGLLDSDEASVEAAYVADSDGDGCDDLRSSLNGGCTRESRVATLQQRTVVNERLSAFANDEGPSPSTMILEVGALEILRGPAPALVVRASGVDGSEPRFPGVGAGDPVVFDMTLAADPLAEAVSGTTALVRVPLVLRDASGIVRWSGELLVVVTETACLGP